MERTPPDGQKYALPPSSPPPPPSLLLGSSFADTEMIVEVIVFVARCSYGCLLPVFSWADLGSHTTVSGQRAETGASIVEESGGVQACTRVIQRAGGESVACCLHGLLHCPPMLHFQRLWHAQATPQEAV